MSYICQSYQKTHCYTKYYRFWSKTRYTKQNTLHWELQSIWGYLSSVIWPKQAKISRLSILGGQSSLLYTMMPNTTNPLANSPKTHAASPYPTNNILQHAEINLNKKKSAYRFLQQVAPSIVWD